MNLEIVDDGNDDISKRIMVVEYFNVKDESDILTKEMIFDKKAQDFLKYILNYEKKQKYVRRVYLKKRFHNDKDMVIIDKSDWTPSLIDRYGTINKII